MDSGPTYFWADKDEKKLVTGLWNWVTSNAAPVGPAQALRELLSRAMLFYFGSDINSWQSASHISRGGEQGELALVRMNHSRSLVQTLYNLILGSKVIWQAIATNSDYKSAAQTLLAAGWLEYLWRDKQVAQTAALALEYGIVTGEGFTFTPWDKSLGDDTKIPLLDEEGNIVGVQKTGDIRYINVPGYDVVRDPRKRSYDDVDWVIVHLRQNKWNVAAEFPELRQKILDAAASQAIEQYGRYNLDIVDTDDVSVYYAFHKRTPALPSGLEAAFISNECLLYRKPLSYDNIPLYRLSAAEMFGTPYGYTSFFEILGLQELVDHLETAIASNQTTFATQMIAAPSGSNISPESFGGLKMLFYPGGLQPPAALQLTKTAPEVFSHIADLIKAMEQLMGLNSVARGEPISGEQSGSALALLESKAKQQSTGLEGSYLRYLSAMGTGTVEIYRKKCPFERRVAISGTSNRALERQLSFNPKEDFSRVQRVQVDVGNPLAQTPNGRMQLADMMAQRFGAKLTMEQFEQVLTTGRIEPLTQGVQKQLLLVRHENERIRAGEAPPVMVDDDHVIHMRGHAEEISNPEVRDNPVALQAYMDHQNEHWSLYTTTDPARLLVFGVQPPPVVAPPGAPLPGPEGTPGPAPGGGAPPGLEPESAPQPLPEQPTNPATGEQYVPPEGSLVS